LSVADRLASLTPEQRALFEALRQKQRQPAAGGPAAPPPIERVSGAKGVGDWPLTFDQERLWFLYFLDPSTTAANMVTATRLRGDLDIAALAAGLNAVVDRHGSWRTTFPVVDGQPWQRVAPALALSLPMVDLSGLDAARREATVRALADADARLPFILEQGPLVRAALVRLAPHEHVCLMTVHHIVGDLASFQIFWGELAVLYAAATNGGRGRPSPLPPLAAQFADFAVWQRRWMAGEVLQAELDWWRRQLRGFPLVLDLPADRPRPLEQTGRGGRWPVTFNSVRTAALRSLSRREGISRFMLLTALAATLFHRLSGQDRLITGTLNANRSRPEVEPLLGFFITQLPLAIDLSGDPTFRELLARVRAMALGAFTHQHLPFGKLVEALQPERDTSRPPVVQALIQLLDAQPGATAGLGSLEIEALDVFDGNARYDLMLGLFEHTDAMAGWLEYNADVFDPATMARMEELLGTLLDAAVAEPGTRLSSLPAFTAACRHQVLVEWNDTAFPGEPQGVLELFAAQATLTPTATAWKGESEETSWSLTFAELDARSNQLARHLRSLGIGTESLVGIYLERTAELPVAILGVLKSGAAYLPLDLSLPPERRNFMLADAGAAAILTQESLLSSLPDSDIPRLCLASLLSLPSLFPPLPPESRAYVIYTSGSTGVPKGVEISHRALANFLRTMRGLFALGPGDTLPALTTIAFDIAVAEMFLPMLAGGTTPLLSAETARDGVLLAGALDAVRPAVVQATPATWRMLLEAGWPGRSESLLVSTAEPLSRDLADRLLPLGRGLWNLYGPTETTVWSTAWRVAPEGPVSIGRPFAETRLYLLDQSLAPVPLGATGELCIGGLGVARGYLGRPELTAERFIPDAFSSTPGDRLYRTGDLVRLRPDGLVESLGRADHQVKLRGFRIELGEIEAALRRHPAVSEAVVLLREDRPGDPRLAAYLGLVPEAEAPTPGHLRQELAARLPDSMIPAAFVFLPSLPLNANGKVDRKALAAIRAEGTADGPRVLPRTPVEELLAGLWSEVLEVEEVGAFDDFFDLGGHSLLATQLVMRMRDVFGVELPLRAIFQAPTLAAQAERVEKARGGEESRRAQDVCHVARAPRDRALPLSFAQERLWFLDQLTPGSPVYNVPVAFSLRGPLDVPALEHAFAEVVRRHEVLRTSFPSRGIHPVQEIAPAAGWTLPMEDLDGWHAAAATEALRPFDLAAGPILRTRLLRLAPEEHVLLLTVHHIAADLWGVAVLIREVAEIYSGKELPELPVQYADFAVWQREWLSGAELERQLAFWRRELEGAPPALELPTDRPRPPVESFHGASLPLTLGGELSRGLRALSRSRGVTPFMTMAAALAVLLSRWTGQDDVVVGSPIANRQAPELAGLIGMFVNTLALRVRLGRASTFDALLAQVRRTALDAFEHQDLPFERLVEELKIGRDLSRHPLFQAVLAFQNVRLGKPEDLAVPGLVLEPLGQESATTKFDLTFTLFEGEDGLAGQLEYATDLFDGATVERLLGHLRNLLEGIAAVPGSLLEELPLLGEEERRHLLAWSGAGLAHRREDTIHGLFAEQAAHTPDAVAVVLGDEEWTYGELAARASRVASHLLRLGVAPETRVAVVGERSLDLVAALLGILQAGCAYLPLDPEHPPERQAFLLADAGASLLLDLEGAEEPSVPRPSPLVSPDQLAYVMYTSGSTGLPKGVAVTHRNVVRLIRDQSFADFGPRETFLQLAPLAFDASTLEIWAPLLNGGRLVLFPGRRASLDEIGAAIARHGVTSLWLTAGLFHQLVDERPETLRPLRQLLAGGDVLDPAHVRRALAALPDLRLVNGYGPTENATFTACHVMTATDPPVATVPIGQPIAGTSIYVLGADLRPVPEGVWGELFAGGDGVARGYLGRPDLTAERFVPDPFGPEPGGRLYRTGDLVRWHGGVLEFLGRRDGQVKIRGHRVELGEIEAALTGHPDVREAVVLLREGRLVAWVTGAPDPAELRRHIAARLPEPMIPSAFVVLDRLLLTPNGKVDRRALPAPEGPEPAATFEAPATAVEESLSAVCTELLGLERVGMRDNFFALGGHSLLATQLVARLRERNGLDVPLQRVFDAADFRELADRIVELAADDSAPIPRLAVRPDPLPLSFAQQRLWFLDRLRPGDPSYNVPAVLEIAGALSPAALRQALEDLAARHEALRTTFREIEDHPAQIVAAHLAVPLPLVDLAALPQTARTPEADRLVRDEVLRPFDLTAGPLLRALLVKQNASLHVLALNLHHIVCDGWSLGVLVREMAALYENASSGTPASLPRLPIQYADFAVWQREWLRGDRLEKQLAFWRDGLAGIEPLRLPTDRPRPTRRGSAGGVRPVVVETADVARLQALALQERATLFIVLLAAWEALLGRLAGQDDLAVGTPVANRNHSETAGLIGFFVNTLVLRGDLSGDPTFRELVGRLRGVALAAFAHQDLPFERLVEELRLGRDPSRTPLFQALLVLQNAPSPALAAGDLEIRDLAAPTATAKFDLSLSLIELPEGIKGALEFSAELFDGATAARFARAFEILLAAAMSNLELRLSELPLATQAERHQLVVEWNPMSQDLQASPPPGHQCQGYELRPLKGASKPDSSGVVSSPGIYARAEADVTTELSEFDLSVRAPIHRLFEAQVDRAPDAPAVTADGETLIYGGLDARANRLARHLLASGVRPGDLVAVKFERSAEMLVAILAVLKAGGAYLPLDPSYPPERLAFALEDSGASLLLTREMLDAEAESIAARSSDRLSVPVDSELPAYVIYTSGSTGQPKGVVIPHGHVTRLFSATRGWFGFGPDDVWTLFHSYAFDFSVWEIWGALLHGGRLVVVPVWQARSPEAFYTLLRDERVTVLNQTPSAFRQLLWAEEAVLEGAQPDLALRYVIFGGEALEPSSLGPWFDRHGDEKPLLVNMYGITETTVHVTYRTVRRSDLAAGSVLGVPILDLTLHVVDRGLTPQPIGVPGEIVVGGEGVARGYLGRPELTAERFVPDPWGAPGARLYRSGDLARRLPDGDLEYLGRIDHQVKIRGYRIELGEIEAALARHPAVREAVVGTMAGPGGETRLVAWITVELDVPPSLSQLRVFLAVTLLEPMLPSALVVLDRFPLTRNGKLDRASLPEPTDGPPADAEQEPPATALEQLVAVSFRDVLGLAADRTVGRHEDFFTLGGSSLTGAVLVNRLQRALGQTIPVALIFDASTPAALAARLEEQSPPRETGPGDLRMEFSAGPAPLSFPQERLWFLDRLTPGTAIYNIPGPLRLLGPLDVPVLARAFDEIPRRHDVLRTRFEERGGTGVQVVDLWQPRPLPLVDLGGLSQTRSRAEVARLTAEEAAWPFDLERGPLLRMLLLRLASEEHVLLQTVHHIVSDGWSVRVMQRELTALYAAFVSGLPSPLSPLPVQYKDFARWQRQRLTDAETARQIDYWRERLGDDPLPLDLPLDRPRPPLQTFPGGSVRAHVPADLADGLRQLAASLHGSLFMALLAAFDLLLARLSGQDDVLVGTPVAGRAHADLESLIGCFLNTLVLRTDLSGNPTFRDLLSQMRDEAVGAYSHQDVPFEKLLEELKPRRDLSRTPLFQVFFNLGNFPDLGARLPGGLTVEPLTDTEADSKFDLTIYAAEIAGGLGLDLVYNADLFDAPRMEEMLRQYVWLLAQAVANPELPLTAFHLLTPEAAALLPDPTAPQNADWPGAVHELFAEQARRHPDRPAVEEDDFTWTYGELAERVRHLASQLRASGVDKGDRVAIWAHRSAPLALAVLGVLEAGAAFVILDPAYPASQLVDRLDLARPRAWVALAAAGPVPGEVEGFLDASGVECRVVIDDRAEEPSSPQPSSPSLPPDRREKREWLALEKTESTPSQRAFSPLSRQAGGRLGERGRGSEGPPRRGAFDGWDGKTAPAVQTDLAYIAFTSGSTGRPKAILGSHGALSHFLPWLRERFALGESERHTMLSGLAHDPLQRDLFTSLCLGGTLCVPSPDDIGTPGRLAAWMARQECTFTNLTPAMATVLTEPPGGGATLATIPTLRWAMLVGDVLTRLDVDRLRTVAPAAAVVNLYGATETVRALGYHVVPASPSGERAREILPLGRGMEDVQLLVLRLGNDSGEPALAGIGEVGEICVRSPHLADGYLDDPELTREAFRINPFTGQPGDRVYRTGDLGRYLPSGDVAFAGRRDQQVKIRGFRVELGEIEAALRRLPGVREAVVIARDGDSAGRRLIAYIVPAVEGVADAHELHEALRAILPAYMIPAAFVFLDRLPLTPNHKVDRRALPDPEPCRASARDLVTPRDGVEQAIAAIWQRLLNLDAVGVDDNFFELGGHSLLGTRVIAALRDELGVEIPLRTLFEKPTVEGLALAVAQARVGQSADSEVDALLDNLEDLSDEEVEALLAAEPRRT